YVPSRHTVVARSIVSLALALALVSGCRDRDSDSASADETETATPDPEASQSSQELAGRLSAAINDANARDRPLEYEYNEDLLKVLDEFEGHQSGKLTGPRPRVLPRLDEEEEVAHLRETIRRWQARTHKDLRAEIDALKAELAAPRPAGGSPFK